MNYEELIGKALIGTAEEKDLAEAQLQVKLACQTAMVCGCGNILDQHSSVYFETSKGKPAGILCQDCAEPVMAYLDSVNEPHTRYSWKGTHHVS